MAKLNFYKTQKKGQGEIEKGAKRKLGIKDWLQAKG